VPCNRVFPEVTEIQVFRTVTVNRSRARLWGGAQKCFALAFRMSLFELSACLLAFLFRPLGACEKSLLERLKSSSSKPVDGYLQWRTQYARIAQGTYGASAQSFIVLRVQLHNPFNIAFTQHTELFSFPWKQRAAYLACLFVSFDSLSPVNLRDFI